MPLDGITAKFLADELNCSLSDARLDKIFQPDRFDIILQFRKDGQNLRLILSANPSSPRVHLTEETRSNPSHPPMFCMLLRKHLSGARLLEVTSPGYERIFKFHFSTTNELGDQLDKTLIAEIMGRHSNIMLLNADGRIHDAISHIDQSLSRVREIMPARPYVEPPAQDKYAPEQALAILEQERPLIGEESAPKKLDKAMLETLQGFSPLLCQAVVVRSGLDDRLKVMQLDDQQMKAFHQAIQRTLQDILQSNVLPTVYFTSPGDKIPSDFHALSLPVYAQSRSLDSISATMNLYYLERTRQNSLSQKKQTLQKALEREIRNARKKLLIHQKDQLDGEKADQYKRYGELLLANMTRDLSNLDQISVIDYYDEACGSVDIPLLPELSLSQNAQRFFKLYNKARTRSENGRRFADQDQQDIDWLMSLSTGLAAAESLEDLSAIQQEIRAEKIASKQDRDKRGSPDNSIPHADRINPGLAGSRQRRIRRLTATGKAKRRKGQSKPEPLLPRKYTSSDGFEILVGRNNLQNDQLTLRSAQKDDLWLHVQKTPGTHVIVRANHQAIPDKTLEEAAQIAAWFSKAAMAEQSGARHEDLSAKVAVDYCPVGHVKKPAGARPGMVIYEHYQTIMVVPKDPGAPA